MINDHFALVDGALEDGPRLHQVRFRAMGCEMGAWVLAEDRVLAAARLEVVRIWMALADSVLTRFDPGSELCRLNATPGVPKQVSPLLWDALDWALHAAEATDGLCNPALLPSLIAAGYDRDFAAVGCGAQDDGVAGDPGAGRELSLGNSAWEAIRRNSMHRTVTLPAGLQIDLGGTAKGWAAERAADMLAPLGPCLVDAGGDLAVRGGLPELDGWPVGIADPITPGGRLTTLAVYDRGVATSGVDVRHWRQAGAERHHLIDPWTQLPAETDLLTATVVAPDVAWADVHALVVMVLGRVDGMAWLLHHAELEGLLVDRAGRGWMTPGMDVYVRGPVGAFVEMAI